MAKKRTVKRRLADGTVKTYRYGPAKPRAPTAESLNAMIRAYRRSPNYRALKPSSRYRYDLYLRPLEEIGHTPAAKLSKRNLNTLRDWIAAERGNGAASLFVAVCGALFNWAQENDWIKANPAFRLKAPTLGEITAWTPAQAEAAEAALPEHLRRAVVLARFTAQRRGDLCAMTWAAYDGATIKVKQQKTGAELVIPCHPRLKAELDAWRRTATAVTILTGQLGRPLRPAALGEGIRKHLDAAGFPRALSIHGLRKLAATELAQAGCSTHEIAAITGHKTLAMVQHYTASVDQAQLASAAIVRLSEKQNAKNDRKIKSGS